MRGVLHALDGHAYGQRITRGEGDALRSDTLAISRQDRGISSQTYSLASVVTRLHHRVFDLVHHPLRVAGINPLHDLLRGKIKA